MRCAYGWRVVDQPQRHALNVASERNRDVLANQSFCASLAGASGEFRAVADEEIDSVNRACGAVLDGVAALRRAAGADKVRISVKMSGIFA